MKRFSAFLIAVVTVLSLTACNGTPLATIKGQKPWDIGSTRIYERSDYSVTRYDGNENVIGKGKMYFILETETEIETEGERNDDLLKLRMHFEADIDQIGKDSIDSEVIFFESSLTPVWTHKKAQMAPRAGTEDESFELEICYNPNYYRSDFREKYDSAKAYFSRPVFNDQNEVLSLPVKSGNYFDNEELFFLIRAMQDLKTGSSLAVNISNGFDIFDADNFFTYLINIVCASNTVNLKMNELITSMFNEEALVIDDEENKLVPCILANAYINGKNRGTPIVLYYSANPFSYNSSEVLLKMETSEYRAESKQLVGRTVYELTNYSVR